MSPVSRNPTERANRSKGSLYKTDSLARSPEGPEQNCSGDSKPPEILSHLKASLGSKQQLLKWRKSRFGAGRIRHSCLSYTEKCQNTVEHSHINMHESYTFSPTTQQPENQHVGFGIHSEYCKGGNLASYGCRAIFCFPNMLTRRKF